MKKKKRWFYKTLFSYLPILFFISSVLFLIFFLAFSEHIKKTTIQTNDVFVEQINQSMNNLLSPIDNLIVKEMLTDDTLGHFFMQQNYGQYFTYEVSHKLNDLIFKFPIINSIYLYNHTNGFVVSDTMFTKVDRFSDRDFIVRQLKQKSISLWTGKREYADQKRRGSQSVVSIVRKLPFMNGEKGMIVVNIKVEALKEYVQNMSSFGTGNIHVMDKQGELIFSTMRSSRADPPAIKNQNPAAKTISDVTGWEVRSDFSDSKMFDLYSKIPYYWVAFGLLSIFIGLIWIILVTRRNYKPVESILNQINETALHKNSELFIKHNPPDEMHFIQTAIENLLEQTTKFKHQYEEDLISIRHDFFKEMVEGYWPADLEKWKEKSKRLGLRNEFHVCVFCITEIDKYTEFAAAYSDKDQYLLKFALACVIEEIALSHGIKVWSEWVSVEKLGTLVMLEEGEGRSGEDLPEIAGLLCERAITWIADNLAFTVTIGVGGMTTKLEGVPDLYRNALNALKYKTALGNQQVIHYAEHSVALKDEMVNYVQHIQMISTFFRMGESVWESRFDQFIDKMKTDMLPREDVLSLLQYLIYHLDLDFADKSEKTQAIWKRHMVALTEMLRELETLEEFRKRASLLLRLVANEFERAVERQNNHKLIHEVRQYIEQNCTNPELSLNHLSEEFQIAPRYLSRLFKEEFDENFVDYLTKLRIEKAKMMLRQTMDPVQSIARKVGYLHSFSFIRVFKRSVGMTPGEYRK